MAKQTWKLSEVWNAVAIKNDRPPQKRDYVYASEIGMPFCDRMLKMTGVEYTNPPNARSRRKFLAGNLFEHIVKQILICSGFYANDEFKVDATPYSDTLAVHGRADFKTINGKIDVDKAMEKLQLLALPDYLYSVGRGIIESLDGVDLLEMILELKSVSSFVFERVLANNRAIPTHSLQGFHYQHNSKIPADICYCCRDDLRMKQFSIDAAIAEPLYKQDLEEITYYFKNKKKKPKIEPLAKFDELAGSFSKNLGVEYSPYLTMLYGFADPDAYRLSVGYIAKWNRALSRFVLAETGAKTATGKPIVLTTKNNEVKAEIIKAGYKFTDLIAYKIAAGVDETELEEVV